MTAFNADAMGGDDNDHSGSSPTTIMASLPPDPQFPMASTEPCRSHQPVITTGDKECWRLRRDLHDALGPILSAVVLQLGTAKSLLDDPSAASALLDQLRDQVKRAITDIRRLVYELSPPDMSELSLVGALREQAAYFRQHSQSSPDSDGLLVVVEAPPRLPTLPAAVQVAAYRIATEALMNAARHAQARTCHVLLTLTVDSALELEVFDDGRGLPDNSRPGVGLCSMRQRAAELGGSCTVHAVPGRGTRVHARLPVPLLKEG